jgi:ankyrin repeat protein
LFAHFFLLVSIVMVRRERLPCCYREHLLYNLYCKFAVPKLYRMAAAGDWDEIPERCRARPKEASFVHRYPPYDSALHKLLRPDHAVLQQELDDDTAKEIGKIKLKAVEALLEADKDTACVPDAFGKTPLLLACVDGSPVALEAAAMILEVNPKAAHIPDCKKQCTPLHVLVSSQGNWKDADTENLETRLILAEKLLQENPSAAHQPDVNGETPLDLAKRQTDHTSSTDALLKILLGVPEISVQTGSNVVSPEN